MDHSSTHTDDALLIQLRKGDEDAFTEIYHRYWEKLYFMAHKRLQSAEDAKEIIQHIFFTLWEKRASLQIAQLSLYLAGMVRYAVYRHIDNQARRHNLVKAYGQTGIPQFSPVIDLENKQLLDILHSLTSDLPEHYRVIFIHHKLLDRPLEEVAAELGVSPRTAERYVAKVMEIMRANRQKLAFTIFML